MAMTTFINALIYLPLFVKFQVTVEPLHVQVEKVLLEVKKQLNPSHLSSLLVQSGATGWEDEPSNHVTKRGKKTSSSCTSKKKQDTAVSKDFGVYKN